MSGTAERHFKESQACGDQGGEWCDLRPRVGQGASGAGPQPETHPQLRPAHQGDRRRRVRGDPGVVGRGDGGTRTAEPETPQPRHSGETGLCAAIGQSSLIRSYERSFEKLGLKVAQILLGHDDLENRKRYLNARHTLEALLDHGVIPIVNENDSVTVDEIKIGDNDTLSANVACMAEAHLLILLSDVDGLYTSDPARSNNSGQPPELISHVERVTPDIEKLAGKSKNPLAVGGMFTKVLAAKKTMSLGFLR